MEKHFDAAVLVRGMQRFVVMDGLLDDPVVAAFVAFLEAREGERTQLYCRFVSALYRCGADLGAHLLNLVVESANPLVQLRAAGGQEPPEMTAALDGELALLGDISRVHPEDFALWAGGLYLPLFQNTPSDFADIYRQRLEHIATTGFGVFARHRMFTLSLDTRLLPVKNPDPQRLEQLVGYDRQREQVVLNTKAMLSGLRANNILLYGDAGTGKSSTVKALANAFGEEGLRLVEVRKNQLYQIPDLMDMLADNPLKFVLFIDDLSFSDGDGEFTALKAILEGNISARPQNVVVYATSNRRHLMRERFADRAGDDVHRGDTLEEQASLSARFGLTVTFLRPDRELYADIVVALAADYGVAMPPQELVALAEAHAIRYGGRSPRTALQFVQLQKAKEALAEEKPAP